MTDDDDDSTGPAPTRPTWFRRSGPRLGAAVALVAIAVVASVQVRAAPTSTTLQRTSGEQAPSISVPDLLNPEQRIDLKQTAGRPVVLNFFASWCVPCRREMPSFEALHERLDDQVAFIGIDHQDRREDAIDLLAETGVTYPTGYDPAGDVARAYALFGMPTTVFISAEGEILARRTGEMDPDELEATINEVLLAP